jgi:hypothetical protein
LRLRCGAAGGEEDSPWKKLGWGGVQGGELLCFLEQGKGDDCRKEWKNEGKSLLSGAAQGHPTACKTSLEGAQWWLGVRRKCGRRDSKKRVAGRGQKSLRGIGACKRRLAGGRGIGAG